MNKLLVLLLIILPTITYAEQKIFSAKIAVVDMQSVFDQSIVINYIRKSLEDINASVQHELTQKETELKNKEKTLIELKDKLNEEEFNQKAEEFNKEVTETQQIIQNKKNKIEQAHNLALSKVYNEMKNIINTLSNKYELNLVIPSSYALYNQPELDITKEVIDILNKQLKKVDIDY